MLGEISQDHVLADRGHSQQPGLPEVTLDLIFRSVSEPAECLHGPVGSLEAGLPCNILRHGCLGAAVLALVVEIRRHPRCQLSRVQAGMAVGKRKLDSLVLTDRPPIDLARPGIVHGFRKRGMTEAYRFERDQDALGVDAIEQHAEAVAFGTDAIALIGAQTFDKQLERRNSMAPHFPDLTHLNVRAVHVHEEESQYFSGAGTFISGRCASQQKAFFGAISLGDPSLVAINPISGALPDGSGADRGDIASEVRLSEAHADVEIPPHYGRQRRCPHLLGSVPHDGLHTKHADVDGARATHARTVGRYSLEDYARLADAQSGPAISLGN